MEREQQYVAEVTELDNNVNNLDTNFKTLLEKH